MFGKNRFELYFMPFGLQHAPASPNVDTTYILMFIFCQKKIQFERMLEHVPTFYVSDLKVGCNCLVQVGLELAQIGLANFRKKIECFVRKVLNSVLYHLVF